MANISLKFFNNRFFLHQLPKSPTQMGSLSVNNSVTKSQSCFLRDLQFRNIKKSLLASDSLFFVQYIVHLLVCTYEKKNTMAVPYRYSFYLGLLGLWFWTILTTTLNDFNSHILNSCASHKKKYKKWWITAPKIGNFFSVMRFEFSLKWVWPRLRSGFQRLHLRTSSSPKNNIIYY